MPQNTDPRSDPACETLAKHLYEFLNRAYPQQTIVQSVRTYDAVNVPYQDYPLLKVYRTSESGSLERVGDEVQATITYMLVLPEMDELAPILVWVAHQIKRALMAYRLQCNHSPQLGNTFRVEYRNMLNELTLKVHSFLRISISFTE